MAIDCGGYSNFNPYRKFDYCPAVNYDFESIFKMKHFAKINFITTESFEQLILAKNNLKYYYHNIFLY
jgi:hypothetical protein